MRHFQGRTALCVVGLLLIWLATVGRRAQSAEIERRIDFGGEFSESMDLAIDEILEISAGVNAPSLNVVCVCIAPAYQAGPRRIGPALRGWIVGVGPPAGADESVVVTVTSTPSGPTW